MSNAIIMDHGGYTVTKDDGKFHIWVGMPDDSGPIHSMDISAGTAAVKGYIRGYIHGRQDGGEARAGLIRKALGL